MAETQATTTSGSTSGSTNLPVQVKERWYTYDAENRLRIVNGELVGNAGEAGTHIRIRADVAAETTPGQIEVSDSYGVAYDAARRAVARYTRAIVNGVVRDWAGFTEYNRLRTTNIVRFAFHELRWH